MALTNTTKIVSAVLGTGTPTTTDIGAIENGSIIMDLGGRLMTKDMSNNLRLISEANRGSLSSPTESANTTRPTTVLSGEYWQTSSGTKYFYDGTNDLPLSDSGLNDNDEWIDTTDKANPIIKVYHSSGSVPKVKEWVALVGDTMTGALKFTNGWIGDINGSIGINTNSQPLKIETDYKGVMIDSSTQNAILLKGNELSLYNKYGTSNQRSFMLNMYDSSGRVSICMKDDTGAIIGDELKVVDTIGDSQWQIGGKDIVTLFTDGRVIYTANDANSSLSNVDWFGDTNIGVQHSWNAIILSSDNLAYLQFQFKLVDFSESLPASGTGKLYYDLSKLIVANHPQITKVVTGIVSTATIYMGHSSSNSSSTTSIYTPTISFDKGDWKDDLGSNGGGLNLNISRIEGFSSHSSSTCNAAWVKGLAILMVERTGR